MDTNWYMLDEQYSEPYKNYFVKYATEKFLYDMMDNSKYCHRLIKTEFNKSLVMTEKVFEAF